MTRIIIVDDHEMFRAGLRTLLEARAGYEVVGEAADGLQMLELIRTRSPQIAITDITMPGMNGVEAVAAFRKLRADVPVIAISASDDRRGAIPRCFAGV